LFHRFGLGFPEIKLLIFLPEGMLFHVKLILQLFDFVSKFLVFFLGFKFIHGLGFVFLFESLVFDEKGILS